MRRAAITPVGLLATALIGVGGASADPVPANQCGAHTDALDCIRGTSPVSGAEARTLVLLDRQYPNVNGMTMLNYLRGSCLMLHDSVVVDYVVKDLAEHLGTSMMAADQVMDAAMAADCPNLHVRADGVAR